MYLFCLLWVPLFYLLRRALGSEGGSGGVWALLLGSITAIFHFFLGDLVEPGGFGVSRWIYGFVDIVGLPVLVPLVIYLLFVALRIFSGTLDFANFALLYLIPVAALRTIGWSSSGSPILLVLVPILWTSLAVGIPLFINHIAQNFRWYVVIFSMLCILALPVAAVSVYWAFFSQQALLGIALLLAAVTPMTISVVRDFVNAD